MHVYARELEVARDLTRRAGEIALRYYRRDVAVETKPDLSPVTVGDRETERYLAAALEEAFPGDGLLGEEGARKESRSGRRWIIDPIDGTRDFVRGSPLWAVFLALEDANEVVAGCVAFPAFGELLWAARGAGAFLDGEPMRVSGIAEVSRAVLSIDSLTSLEAAPFGPRVLPWMARFSAVRSMGGCYDAMMVARGQAELWIETSGQPWDFAALKIVAEEAGARFFDFEGRSTIYGGSAVISNPGLESEARRFLGLADPR